MLILEDIEDQEQYLIEAYSREELEDLLQKGTAVISFKKRTNGRFRILYGTRDLKLIPKEHHPSGGGLPYDPKAKGLIIVFDLIKKRWRSFGVNDVSQAAEKSLNWLARMLRRRKYTTDHGSPQKESYQGTELSAYQITGSDLLPENFIEEDVPFCSFSRFTSE